VAVLRAAVLHDERRAEMASRGKKKTTFAKLARESRLRERRIEKQAKKEERRRTSENPPTQGAAVGEER
jgi:hypothetical protein